MSHHGRPSHARPVLQSEVCRYGHNDASPGPPGRATRVVTGAVARREATELSTWAVLSAAATSVGARPGRREGASFRGSGTRRPSEVLCWSGDGAHVGQVGAG